MSKISRYTFCHIPKTGGTSIIELLNYKGASHNITRKKNADDFLFTFVRNPYTRCLSAYHYLKNGGNGKFLDFSDKERYIGDSDFEDFVIYKLEFAASQQQHFRPQHYWIPDGADFIGKFETFEDDVKILRDYIQLKNIPTPHLNKTNYNKNFIVSQNLEDVIYNIYEKDFALFDYLR